ncbi:L-seryl-tRNA selenium transferase [Photorhabdus asymbiotica]|uniref:L-seryl-tRNA selenium transferase n=1 Tax=Photorhabdus asymbiotica TaxID=291112 RepID=A0ABX9SQK1_9GAMM|nr:L-seryl-tRNA selenium transferase [Photorhabdus asymbiotica]
MVLGVGTVIVLLGRILLCELTGAEDACVVNNNGSSCVVMLATVSNPVSKLLVSG